MAWKCGTVSVLIRTLNEAELLGQVLSAVAAQQCKGDGMPGWVETVIVDSGSTDGTPALAAASGARVVHIPSAAFTYGRALNLGVQACRGDLVAVLSGHAVPATDSWLAAMVRPLLEDPQLAGVFGRQLNWERSTALDGAIKYLQGVSGLWRARFSGELVPWFSNANACIRRSVALAVQFDESLNGSEDRAWAAAVQALGWKTGYEPDAAAFHTHGVTFLHMLERLAAGRPMLSSG